MTTIVVQFDVAIREKVYGQLAVVSKVIRLPYLPSIGMHFELNVNKNGSPELLLPPSPILDIFLSESNPPRIVLKQIEVDQSTLDAFKDASNRSPSWL